MHHETTNLFPSLPGDFSHEIARLISIRLIRLFIRQPSRPRKACVLFELDVHGTHRLRQSNSAAKARLVHNREMKSDGST